MKADETGGASSSEDVARRVLEHISDAVLVCDDHGKLTFVCANVRQIFGWTVDEAFQRGTVEALLGPSLVEPSLLAERGEITNIEREVVTRDGTCRRLLITVRSVSIGPGTMLFVCRDVTHMRALEETVRHQAQLLKSVRESVVATDLEGRITYWGPGAAELYGWSENEALGQHVGLIVEPQSLDEERARIEAVRTNGYWEGVYRQRSRRGEAFWAEARISLVRDANGRPAGLVGVDRDVTAFMEMERALRLTDRALHDLVSSKTVHARLDRVLAELMAFSASEAGAIRLIGEDGSITGECGAGWPQTVCRQLADADGSLRCPCRTAYRGSASASSTASGTFVGCTRQQIEEQYPEAQRLPDCALGRFESVVVVPVRCQGQVRALMYLADHRPERFSESVVAGVERIATVLALLLCEPDLSRRQERDVAVKSRSAPVPEQLRSVVRALHDPAALLEADGTVRVANTAFASELGVPADEIDGRSVLPRLEARQRLVLSDHLHAVCTAGDRVRWEDQWGERLVELCATPVDTGTTTVSCLLTLRSDSEELAAERSARAALQASLDGIPDPVWVKGMDGRLLVVNRALCRIWGRGRDELIGSSIEGLMPREVSARFEAEDRAVAERGERLAVEERIVDAAGDSDWYETVKSPVVDQTGRVIGASGIARNISARRATESTLREHEARLRRTESFVRGLAAAAEVLIETHGQVPYQRVVEVLGAASRASRTYVFQIRLGEHGEVLASQVAEWCAPDVAPQIDNPKLQNIRFDTLYARWVRLLLAGEAVSGRVAEFPEVERPILEEQGILALLVLPLRVDGELVGFIGFDDCSSDGGWDDAEREFLATAANTVSTAIERHRARSQLEAAHHLLRRTFDEAPIGAAIVAPDGVIEQVNEELCAMVRRRQGELVGSGWLDLIDVQSRSTIRSVMQHLTSGRSDHAQMECRLVRRDGDPIWGRISLRLLREHGQPLRFIPMVEDITEGVLARKQLQESESQLRALASEVARTEERERRRLASELHDNLGHELALAAIHLDSGLHQLQPTSERQRADLENVREGLARAITSVRSLTFDLSPPELYQLGLRAAVDSLVERLGARSELAVDVIEIGAPRKLSDDLRALCFTVVRELLVNVVKHAGVSTAGVELHWRDSRLSLKVVDRGAGFAPEIAMGSGFGLLSMRERLHLLGGEMLIESAPGEGTEIAVSVPLDTSDTLEGRGGRTEDA